MAKKNSKAASIPVDSWLINAMQGITFWVGHRHAFFSSYPLSESALVAEFCNLVAVQLPNGKYLLPERLYRTLTPKGSIEKTNTTRADLIITNSICPGPATKNIASCVEYVIEIKRATSSKKERNKDLCRLCEFLSKSAPGTRAFLLVISESIIPDDYVSSKSGTGRKGKYKIKSQEKLSGDKKVIGHYRMRRTCKAAKTFKSKKAHYACLLEVFPLKSN